MQYTGKAKHTSSEELRDRFIALATPNAEPSGRQQFRDNAPALMHIVMKEQDIALYQLVARTGVARSTIGNLKTVGLAATGSSMFVKILVGLGMDEEHALEVHRAYWPLPSAHAIGKLISHARGPVPIDIIAEKAGIDPARWAQYEKGTNLVGEELTGIVDSLGPALPKVMRKRILLAYRGPSKEAADKTGKDALKNAARIESPRKRKRGPAGMSPTASILWLAEERERKREIIENGTYFKSKLEYFIGEHGKTNEGLAISLNMGIEYVDALLSGKIVPRIPIIMEIATYLGLSPQEILELSEAAERSRIILPGIR